jgi:hypothetical protein
MLQTIPPSTGRGREREREREFRRVHRLAPLHRGGRADFSGSHRAERRLSGGIRDLSPAGSVRAGFFGLLFLAFLRNAGRAKYPRRHTTTYEIFDLAASVPTIQVFQVVRLIRVLWALHSSRLLVGLARQHTPATVLVDILAMTRGSASKPASSSCIATRRQTSSTQTRCSGGPSSRLRGEEWPVFQSLHAGQPAAATLAPPCGSDLAFSLRRVGRLGEPTPVRGLGVVARDVVLASIAVALPHHVDGAGQPQHVKPIADRPPRARASRWRHRPFRHPL